MSFGCALLPLVEWHCARLCAFGLKCANWWPTLVASFAAHQRTRPLVPTLVAFAHLVTTIIAADAVAGASLQKTFSFLFSFVLSTRELDLSDENDS